ncbi:uncharacterized protein GGS25DRAFT_368989 [Hypoxylon fragiforme]|uniref:uncharacterized protein n=1 Tax=Hypoxylon fragiforme TaxID=63214 RepID=UPI0020C6E12B|nr:uncharacterized protein GGS25DRAFT_368989 [Hypoxylon fragiforme]KAI2606001.1 hypothetical protein GGS25DRAFT_368989 [Hypoxylon fragiforme]
MVEIMRAPSLGQTLSSSSSDMMDNMSSRFHSMDFGPASESTVVSQQQQKSPTKESVSQNSTPRAPRRAFTSAEHPATLNSVLALKRQQRLPTPAATPREVAETDSYFDVQPPNPPAASPIPSSLRLAGPPTIKRPVLPGPLRSYSVTDVEPVPFTHQPGVALTLEDMPPELHYAIFDFLDPIDSTCLGLTSPHFYAIHRRMHGTVPLSARREGPNDMEWVWRNAFISGPFVGGANGSGKQNALATLSPRGQVYCRKCRTARCELHNHIREWVGDGVEYCEVSQKFGPAAHKNARGFCYRSSPKHPHRCGRHTRQQRAVRLT